ncbi:hypothetical protein [Niabella drilacis]|uniref:Uncharacterized protein n=1 Tax=Niabella drilacis (strain DSM 25811 / CCM 8410 / CCUG 62505 / LMG 26954 / E90) TaxID=1285928 RepID=A0A1G6QWS2_NIADE|nr:hypothetical protein [Niabella drilacis]SDC96909.1 hypothetical protein SAMN04487894_10557 [Niabella drilacis]
MTFCSIFVFPNNKLYAVKFDGETQDEYQKAFNQWQDVEYLHDFFEEHKADLENGFYNCPSVDEAIAQTLKESREFEQRIRALCKQEKNNLNDVIFRPLNKKETKIELQQNKAYGMGNSRSWLRLYAIRLSQSIYFVTGSAIKLTATMSEREHTKKELEKLTKVAQDLKDEGIIEEDDFGYLEIQNQ